MEFEDVSTKDAASDAAGQCDNSSVGAGGKEGPSKPRRRLDRVRIPETFKVVDVTLGKEGKDGKDKQKQNKGEDSKNKDKKDQQKQDQKKQQGDKGKIPKQQQAAQAKGKPAKKDIDPKQARAILRKMAEKEKNLRDAIKAHRKRVYKNIEVEKDW